MATNSAVVDSQTGVVLGFQSVDGNVNQTQPPPQTYFVALVNGLTASVGDQYNNPSDGVFRPAAQVSASATNASQLRVNASQIQARLRQIRDAPQITTANLASVQALQGAVQDEARALIGLIRVMLNQFDGTT